MNICSNCFTLFVKFQKRYNTIQNTFCTYCYNQYKRNYNIQKSRAYLIKNYDELKIKRKNYYNKNKNLCSDRRKTWASKNRKYLSDYANIRQKERSKVDINYKLKIRLRNRIRMALKRGSKSGSAVSDLGCSIQFFKNYIESKFKTGMNWNNYGKWQLDHIIPLSSFDLSNRSEFLKAVHYSNFQPLWAYENNKKGCKII